MLDDFTGGIFIAADALSEPVSNSIYGVPFAHRRPVMPVACVGPIAVVAASEGWIPERVMPWHSPTIAPELPPVWINRHGSGDPRIAHNFVARLLYSFYRDGPVTIIVEFLEAVGVTDSLSKVLDVVLTMDDPVGLLDVLSLVGVFARTITDVAPITDVLSKVYAGVVAFADDVGITDAVSKVYTGIKTVSDAVGITDAISWPMAVIVAIAEAVGVTDAMTKVLSVVLSMAEAVGVTDSISRVIDWVRTITEDVGITDTMTAVMVAVTHYLYARFRNLIFRAREE